LSKIAILPQVLPVDNHFVWKGCSGTSKLVVLLQFMPIDPHIVRKGCPRKWNRHFYLSFRRSNFSSCERITPGQEKS
jgi:hypothetical protein